MTNGRPRDNAPADTSQRLDDLYRQHPEGFVAGRDQLVKELRAAGHRDQADRVKKLQRPTAAAWLINCAALSSPAQSLEEFAKASRELEDTQARALEGKDEGAAEWRAAAARERVTTRAVVDLGESLAREAGLTASARALELAGETLRAATGDPELRERVLEGRVEREQSAATLGTPAGDPPSRRAPGSAKRRDLAQARRELKRLEGELADATAGQERLRARVEEASKPSGGRGRGSRKASGRRPISNAWSRRRSDGRRARSGAEALWRPKHPVVLGCPAFRANGLGYAAKVAREGITAATWSAAGTASGCGSWEPSRRSGAGRGIRRAFCPD